MSYLTLEDCVKIPKVNIPTVAIKHSDSKKQKINKNNRLDHLHTLSLLSSPCFENLQPYNTLPYDTIIQGISSSINNNNNDNDIDSSDDCCDNCCDESSSEDSVEKPTDDANESDSLSETGWDRIYALFESGDLKHGKEEAMNQLEFTSREKLDDDVDIRAIVINMEVDEGYNFHFIEDETPLVEESHTNADDSSSDEDESDSSLHLQVLVHTSSDSDEDERANLFYYRIIETINTAHKKEKKEAEKQLHDVLDSTLRKELDYNEDLAAVVKKMEAKGYNFHFHEDENSSVKRTNKHIVCDDKNRQKRQKINNNNNNNNDNYVNSGDDSSDDSSEGSFYNIISSDSDESSEESF